MTVFSLDVGDHGQCDLRVAGTVDRSDANQLITLGLLSLTNTDATCLVIDLADTTFMDSTGLGALVTIRNAAENLAKDLRLRAVPDQIGRMLTVASLDKVFVVDSPDETGHATDPADRDAGPTHVRQTA